MAFSSAWAWPAAGMRADRLPDLVNSGILKQEKLQKRT